MSVHYADALTMLSGQRRQPQTGVPAASDLLEVTKDLEPGPGERLHPAYQALGLETGGPV